MISTDERNFILSNGISIPAIGYGTGIATGISNRPLSIAKRFVKEQIKNIIIPNFKKNNSYTLSSDYKKDKQLKIVAKFAADHDCRLFDTARAYSYSESYLGEALSEKIKNDRDSVFFITKVSNRAQRENAVMKDLEMSLKNLGTDYIDLYLVHWPQTDTYLDTWKIMEKIYESGVARAIGMCNCHIHHLEKIKKVANIMPMVNELECHPFLQQKEIRNYCNENNIKIIAHTPTGKMRKDIANSDIMKEICSHHNVKASQVILRWHYQLGDICIPNTTNKEHLLENLDIWNFRLDNKEMIKMEEFDCNYRIWPNPDNCDFMKL